MGDDAFRHRLGLIGDLGSAYSAEIAVRDPAAAIPWERWPDVAAVTDHLGGNHRWAAAIVASGQRVNRADIESAPESGVGTWFDDGVEALVSTLGTAGPARPCWVLGVRPEGTAAFWARRMVIETAKHLVDVRASGGGTWRSAPELPAPDAADAIDELFEAFLPRSRPRLDPLPGSLVLSATDLARTWTIGSDWQVREGRTDPAPSASVSGMSTDLLLFVWQRATPVDDARFVVDGDPDVVRAFAASPVHP